MKKAKFLVSHFDSGVEKFKAGEEHELTEETRLCIARGAAVEIDVADPERTGPERSDLDGALDRLPDGNTDPEYVVKAMRAFFGDLFTDADEVRVRELVKPRAEPVTAAPVAPTSVSATAAVAAAADAPVAAAPAAPAPAPAAPASPAPAADAAAAAPAPAGRSKRQ